LMFQVETVRRIACGGGGQTPRDSSFRGGGKAVAHFARNRRVQKSAALRA